MISNNDYIALFEENENIFLLVDKESGDIVHANKAACTYYHYQYEQITSMNITDINIMSKEEIANEIEKATLEKRNYLYFTHRLRNNELRKVEVYSSSLIINNKEYLFLIIFDIKDQDNQQLMMTGLFYESPNALIIVNNEKKVLTVNKAFTKLFGYQLEDFQSKSLEELIVPKNKQEDVLINLDDVLDGEIVNRTAQRYTKDRKAIDVNITATPYIINNEIIGALIVYRDIREQIRIKKESEEVNRKLKETNDHLQLILDSTVEAIFGLDIEGNCTFCNLSGIEMLGYPKQEDLMGKKMHDLIHHSYKDGRMMPLSECKIYKSMREGKSVHVDDEVFWRADGSYFDVNYYAHPQTRNGEIIGAVVTFTDITERKKYEEHIKYISYHDALTGLYNRRFLEEAINRFDIEENLPISVIYGDVNGLKLTNDIFGHHAGDLLLTKAAEIFTKATNDETIITRVGGDEFLMLLPKTDKEMVKHIARQIKHEYQKERFAAIKGSISLGYDTKTNDYEDLIEIIKTTEAWMYKDKMANKKTLDLQMIHDIIKNLHSKSPKEEVHSKRVSLLAKEIAEKMGMSKPKVRKVKDAAYYHDIGKIVLDDTLLKTYPLIHEEKEKMKQHPIVGYRILNLFTETMELAEGVLCHHEYWDGTGFPKGLKGEEIPLTSRIIAVAEAFETFTNEDNIYKLSKIDALNEIKKEAGKKYDPMIVEILEECIKNQ